eukprot:4829432-Amphidinium_carterae.1
MSLHCRRMPHFAVSSSSVQCCGVGAGLTQHLLYSFPAGRTGPISPLCSVRSQTSQTLGTCSNKSSSTHWHVLKSICVATPTAPC